jgi:hypothetical protein
MPKKISYRILTIGLSVGLSLLVSTLAAKAQEYVTNAPTQADIYCAGIVSDKPVPNETYVISGEDSAVRVTFQQGQLIYINRGGEQGVRIGDQFEVVRPVSDMMAANAWFKYETMLSRAMGTRYADIGQLRIVHVEAKTSTAELTLGCDLVQRGDIVRPFVARPVPQFRAVKLDPFAAPSGKKTAMVVSAKDYTVLSGPGGIVYVNLGSAQGVRVGDYFRVFRYQGTRIERVAQDSGSAYKVYGFGSTPVAYQWDNLPRQIVGEGIVVRTGANSSTVLVTAVRGGLFIGDYVELE